MSEKCQKCGRRLGSLKHVVKKGSRNIGTNDQLDFNHISYPATLPGGVKPAGEKPL